MQDLLMLAVHFQADLQWFLWCFAQPRLTDLLLFSKHFMLCSSFFPLLIYIHFSLPILSFIWKAPSFTSALNSRYLLFPFVGCLPWLSLPISHLYLQGSLFNLITYNQILSQGLPGEERKLKHPPTGQYLTVQPFPSLFMHNIHN